MFRFLKWAWNVIDDRLGISKVLLPIARHPVPKKAGWAYVFGSATLIAFLVQVVTGTVLATVYVPSAGHAYDTMQYITHHAFLGHVVRGLHYWGAAAMILFIGLHSIRTYLTGSYKFPREANWISGGVLMVLTLGMGFTGQLLVWDQNALWSTVVGAEQAAKLPVIGKLLGHWTLAGNTVGGATLSRFFAAHVFFFPGLIFVIVGLHLYLVIHHGISEPPKAGRPVDPKTYRAWYQDLLKREGVPFWPDAAWRDITFGFLLVVTLFLLAWFVGPPKLSKPPDPTIIEAAPHPYWYFTWYLAVLATAPHAGEKFIIIAVPSVFFLVMFALPFIANKGERSPLRRPWSMGLVLLSVIVIGVFWREGLLSPWVPDFKAQPLPETVVGISDGPVHQGAVLFHDRGCEFCHNVSGFGGHRGPDLTDIGNRLTREQMVIRIMNGGYNMPSYAGILKSNEADDIVAFLQSRTIRGAGIPNQPTK